MSKIANEKVWVAADTDGLALQVLEQNPRFSANEVDEIIEELERLKPRDA